MGIRNLHTFLRSINIDLYKKKKLEEYRGKSFAVDTSIYMCRYKSSMGSKWLNGFWLLISLFKKHGINLIFVLDSKPPPEKELERSLRSAQKEKNKQRVDTISFEFFEYKKEDKPFTNIDNYLNDIENKYETLYTYVKKYKNTIESEMDIFYQIQKLQNSIINIHTDDFTLLKELFTILNIPFVYAHSEAEGTCAYLSVQNIVDGVLTEDTDVLTYGGTVMLHSLKLKDGTIMEIELNNILQTLNFSMKQFVDFCIMCGTDYNDNIPKLGPKTCFSLLQKNENLENIDKLEKYNTKILNYLRVRNLFRFDDYQIDTILSNSEPPEKLQIQQFLFKNNLSYSKEMIEYFTLKNEKNIEN